MRRILVIIMLLVTTNVFAQEDYDLATFLMKSTFKLSGSGSQGTCFIIGRPIKDNPGRARYVLVTAAHVLESMKDGKAIIHLRKKEKDTYRRIQYPIAIRNKGKDLWTKHSQADVAAMYVSLPEDIDIVLLPLKFLASDDTLRKFEIRPGDRLFALGFPLGQESNEAGFPILRTGTIASYPILPTKETKHLLFDFEVFKGNSGGPVFMIEKNRSYGGSIHIGTLRFIVGLVTQERSMIIHTRTPYEEKRETHPLKLGVVVHASLVKETIEQLPEE